MTPGRVFVTLLAALAMEPISAGVHRSIGHGIAWPLHRRHHHGPEAGPELNDVIPAASAVLTMALFVVGTTHPGLSYLVSLAAGATLYGAAYFLVHDCYIHRRVPLLPRHVRCLEPLKRAHLEHHRTGTGNWGIFSGHRTGTTMAQPAAHTPPPPSASLPDPANTSRCDDPVGRARDAQRAMPTMRRPRPTVERPA
jgi:beta-carotene 3-hydroxylase